MPKVGSKVFKYTKKGKEEAKKYAKKTGKKMNGIVKCTTTMYKNSSRKKAHNFE